MIKTKVNNSDIPVLLSFCSTVETEISRQLKNDVCNFLFLQKKADKRELQALTKTFEIRMLKLTRENAKKKFQLSLTPAQSLLFIKYQSLYEQKIKTNKSAVYNRNFIEVIGEQFISQITNL